MEVIGKCFPSLFYTQISKKTLQNATITSVTIAKPMVIFESTMHIFICISNLGKISHPPLVQKSQISQQNVPSAKDHQQYTNN